MCWLTTLFSLFVILHRNIHYNKLQSLEENKQLFTASAIHLLLFYHGSAPVLREPVGGWDFPRIFIWAPESSSPNNGKQLADGGAPLLLFHLSGLPNTLFHLQGLPNTPAPQNCQPDYENKQDSEFILSHSRRGWGKNNIILRTFRERGWEVRWLAWYSKLEGSGLEPPYLKLTHGGPWRRCPSSPPAPYPHLNSLSLTSAKLLNSR